MIEVAKTDVWSHLTKLYGAPYKPSLMMGSHVTQIVIWLFSPILVADEAAGSYSYYPVCVHCGAVYDHDWERMQRTTASPANLRFPQISAAPQAMVTLAKQSA